MSLPEIVSREQWLAARTGFLTHEKEMTRQRDGLNADRRRLPMVRIDKDYVFTGPEGTVRLPDLFDGSSQLITYHAMFDPSWEKACPGCTASMDESSPGTLAHLKARGCQSRGCCQPRGSDADRRGPDRARRARGRLTA